MEYDLKAVRVNAYTFNVVRHDVKLGELEVDDAGYYNYWPDKDRHGSYSAQYLRALAALLDAINKPYERELRAHFSEASRTLPPDLAADSDKTS